jgi:hypothetical protein
MHATGFSENEFEQDEAGEQREKQYVLEVGHQVLMAVKNNSVNPNSFCT